MESTVNAMLRYALEVIEEKKEMLYAKDKKQIDDIYESYLAQFGPMCVQLLLPSTFAVFCKKNSEGSDGDRKLIIEMIYEVFKKSQPDTVRDYTSHADWSKAIMRNCEDYAGKNEDLILDAGIALKRAIRTYELVKKHYSHGKKL